MKIAQVRWPTGGRRPLHSVPFHLFILTIFTYLPSLAAPYRILDRSALCEG